MTALPPESMFSVLVAVVSPSKVRVLLPERERVTFDPMVVVTPLPSVTVVLLTVMVRIVALSDCRV